MSKVDSLRRYMTPAALMQMITEYANNSTDVMIYMKINACINALFDEEESSKKEQHQDTAVSKDIDADGTLSFGPFIFADTNTATEIPSMTDDQFGELVSVAANAMGTHIGKKHNEWRGWPGTYLLCRVALETVRKYASSYRKINLNKVEGCLPIVKGRDHV